MQDQGGTSVGVTHRTELAEPALVPRLDGAAGGAALADPHQEDMLSQVDGSVWHPNPEMWSLHVWPLQGY